MSEPTSADLLRRFVSEESHEAFRALVAREFAFVYSVARRQVGGDSHLADEVTQQVFLELIRCARSLAKASSLTGWLHQAARFAARKALRGRRRLVSRQHAAALEVAVLAEEGPQNRAWESIRPLLDDALGELRSRDREIILECYFHEASAAEVGQRLGISENAARVRIDRALDRLRARFERRGLRSTAAAIATAMRSVASEAPVGGAADHAASTVLARAALARSTPSLAGAFGAGGWSAIPVGWAVGLAMLTILAGTGLALNRRAGPPSPSFPSEVATNSLLSVASRAAPTVHAVPPLASVQSSPKRPSDEAFRRTLFGWVKARFSPFAEERHLSEVQRRLLFEILTDHFGGAKPEVRLQAAEVSGDERKDANLAWEKENALLRQLLGDSGPQAIAEFDRKLMASDVSNEALRVIDPERLLPPLIRDVAAEEIGRFNPSAGIGDYVSDRTPIGPTERARLEEAAALRVAAVGSDLAPVLSESQLSALKGWARGAVDSKIDFANSMISFAQKGGRPGGGGR